MDPLISLKLAELRQNGRAVDASRARLAAEAGRVRRRTATPGSPEITTHEAHDHAT